MFLACSYRSHPCSPSTTKTLLCKPNTEVNRSVFIWKFFRVVVKARKHTLVNIMFFNSKIGVFNICGIFLKNIDICSEKTFFPNPFLKKPNKQKTHKTFKIFLWVIQISVLLWYSNLYISMTISAPLFEACREWNCSCILPTAELYKRQRMTLFLMITQEKIIFMQCGWSDNQHTVLRWDARVFDHV